MTPGTRDAVVGGRRRRRQRTTRGVTPASLVRLMLAIILLGIVGFAVWWLTRPDVPAQDDGIVFAAFDKESTATVSFAGSFPPDDRPPMARPLGIDGDGEFLYIAEADSGVVSVREYDGTLIETIAVPAAEGASGFYPVDVAVLPDGTIGVVDTAGSRVVWIDPRQPERFGDIVAATDARQPTAIASSESEVYVADALSGSIVVFEGGAAAGATLRALGGALEPPLSFVGGLAFESDTLIVSDSNGGRVVVLDAESGEQLRVFQRRLELPRDIAIVLDGDVAVVETFAALVSVFDPTGATRVDTVGDAETEGIADGGTLAAPEGAFWDAAGGRLYVTDAAAGRCRVYNVRKETGP